MTAGGFSGQTTSLLRAGLGLFVVLGVSPAVCYLILTVFGTEKFILAKDKHGKLYVPRTSNPRGFLRRVLAPHDYVIEAPARLPTTKPAYLVYVTRAAALPPSWVVVSAAEAARKCPTFKQFCRECRSHLC